VNAIDNELAALGKNIRRAREKLNISQEELASRCGLHRTYVSDIERGARNLSFSSLLAVAQGLGSTVSELTRDTGSLIRPSWQVALPVK
jgi:transcriptional regulator with XRE-family HTH domain